MKKKLVIFGLAATFILGACNVANPSTSNGGVNGSIWSSDGGISMNENKNIGLTSGYILNTYKAGDEMLMSLHEQANYLILDNDGRIIYTAANVKAGYGNVNQAYAKGYDITIVDGKMTLPAGTKGYNITNEGYEKLVNAITNSAVKLSLDGYKKDETTTLWNSTNNEYIDDKITVTVEDESNLVKNKEAVRLSSIYDDLGTTGKAIYKMVAPYEDEYKITSSKTTKIEIFDAAHNLLADSKNSVSVILEKDQLVYVSLTGPASTFVEVTVTLKDNYQLNPYDVLEQENVESYDVYGDANVDPLESQQLSVQKRKDSRGLYINCNNPEALETICLNKVLTKADCTNRDVFFTFEHNNKTSHSFYYGYRVTNVGNEDMYVTVKNIGHQIGGPGSWLGEDEWIKFYNIKFDSKMDQLNESQLSNFDAYVGFSNKYEPGFYQPITYRVPAGQYIYVMGGTTRDAYQNINVFGTADQKVNPSETGCSNGSVLFSVRGSKALGQFMAYRDNDAKNINKSEYVTEQKELGYMKNNGYGAQYVGYDNCHGVVDTALTYIFNDKTPAKALPVSYENPYYTTETRGPAFSKIENFSPKTHSNLTGWVTHINPNGTANAVGTDMTQYITIDYETGEPIIISPEYFDGRDRSDRDAESDGTGTNANIGNWMVDYIDTFTLVNQGDKERTVTYNLGHSGVILTYIRDANGKLDTSIHKPTYNVKVNGSSYGQAIIDTFSYSVTIPPHSVVRFSVDYNLLANSYGYITHNLLLK